jgi:hypothetical protein
VKALTFDISTVNLKYSNDLQINWVSLPTARFGPVSDGIYLQFPWNPKTRSQAVIGCSISAMWYYTDVASDSTIGDEAWSIIKSEQSSQNITMDLTPPPLKLVTTTASLRSKSVGIALSHRLRLQMIAKINLSPITLFNGSFRT